MGGRERDPFGAGGEYMGVTGPRKTGSIVVLGWQLTFLLLYFFVSSPFLWVVFFFSFVGVVFFFFLLDGWGVFFSVLALAGYRCTCIILIRLLLLLLWALAILIGLSRYPNFLLNFYIPIFL